MKKKNIAIINIMTVLIIMAVLVSFTACSEEPDPEEEGISVVCTVFPIYDWVRNIVGDTVGVSVSLILDSGTDMHSYQPSVSDVVEISSCDLLVYVGGESDKWVSDLLSGDTAKGVTALSLTEALSDLLLFEETVEGMQTEEHDHSDHDHSVSAYDEHIWLSLKNAIAASDAVTDALCELDRGNAEAYRANAQDYISRLSRLDAELADAELQNKAVIVCDRFPFVYLMKDYGIEYYAAFPGCSTETDADFETVIFLAKKTDEIKPSALIVTESSDKSLAETVLSNSAHSADIAVLDSMQSLGKKEIEGGAVYIDIMEKNIEALKSVLN